MDNEREHSKTYLFPDFFSRLRGSLSGAEWIHVCFVLHFLQLRHVTIQSSIPQSVKSGWHVSGRLLMLWAPYDFSYLFILIAHMPYCLAWHQRLCVLTWGNLSRFSTWLPMICSVRFSLPVEVMLAHCRNSCSNCCLSLLSPEVSIKSLPTFIDHVTYTFLAWFLRFVLILWHSQYLLCPFITHNNNSQAKFLFLSCFKQSSATTCKCQYVVNWVYYTINLLKPLESLTYATL